ncbi:MAG: hypothetical protein M0Z36_08965 [Thermaerobacter sp.]|nr:hypothetical protein [Thermaerobacter sp.]
MIPRVIRLACAEPIFTTLTAIACGLLIWMAASAPAWLLKGALLTASAAMAGSWIAIAIVGTDRRR